MTVISIEVDSKTSGSFGHPATKISTDEIVALATACAKLLDSLGSSAWNVELLKVIPWHAYGGPNIFDVKAVLSAPFNDLKVESKMTFEAPYSSRSGSKGWDLSALPGVIAEKMLQDINRAINNRILDIKKAHEAWGELLRKTKKV